MQVATKYSENEVESSGAKSSQAFGFSADAQEMMFAMFTKNIYSNPIGSVVREITSNCFDSHKEAEVKDAVIVKLSKENGDFYISFIDVGVGMSRERVTKVYSKYFESTKRNDNNQIGGFGIGGKTPLAYTESFFLITVSEGVKYTYNIYKGKSSPVLELLSQNKTKEKNGTTIKVPVRSTDVYTFESEIIKQLYYFENVIFEGFSDRIKNNYKIFEGQNFLFRGNDYSMVHVCLGRVAYPINFDILGDEIKSREWNVPIALKFNIGEINVTASREAIDYTSETKKLLITKLNQVKKELTGMLEQQHKSLDSLEQYYRLENSYSELLLNVDVKLEIRPMLESGYRPYEFKRLNAIRIPNQLAILKLFYSVSTVGKKKSKRNRSSNLSNWDGELGKIANEPVYLLTDDDQINRKKNAYLKAEHTRFFNITEFELDEAEILKMIEDEDIKIKNVTKPVDDKIVRKQFNILREELKKLVEKHTKRYAAVTVPDDFKATEGQYDPNFELPVGYSRGEYGFGKQRIKLAELAQSKAQIYYGDVSMEHEIQWMSNTYYQLFSPTNNGMFRLYNYDNSYSYPIRFITVAKNNLKYIKQLEMANMHPANEFYKLLNRKRGMVEKTVMKDMFKERYNGLNRLFLNEKIFATLDKSMVNSITKLNKQYRSYTNKDNVNYDSKLLGLLNIDKEKMTLTNLTEFMKVEQQTEKNPMFSYVSISDDYNPARGGEKDNKIIMQLLSTIYVK